MKINLINIYIAKNFLTRFFQVIAGFSLLIFFINFIDILEHTKDAPLYVSVALAALQIPDFLNDISPSMVLISAIIGFFSLSSKSEISIIRMSGFSLWQVLQPIAVSAFLLGIFWITIFDPISVQAMKKFNHLEAQYVKNETRDVVEPTSGIWVKQSNLEKPDEEIIIRAQKAYRESDELGKVNVWFFDKNDSFYRKIDANSAKLEGKNWVLSDDILNENDDILNKKMEQITIPTDLTADFVMNKIVNNFQNVKLFSFFELPNLIRELSAAGFASIKFKVYFHSLLSRPLIFTAMTLIACFFGLNHIRNQNTVLMLFFGILIGLGLYITSSIVNALGSSGLIPVFASTWIIAIICLAIGTLLIYKKEHF